MLRRNSYRLPSYDYAEPGFYFVTLCVQPRQGLFGRLEWIPPDPQTATVRLNAFGECVAKHWQRITTAHPVIRTDTFVVMPDHLHGIIEIVERELGASRFSLPRKGSQKGALGTVIGTFKGAITKDIRKLAPLEARSIWQRDFFDHVIRDERALRSIREYIIQNPMRRILKELDASNERKLGVDGR